MYKKYFVYIDDGKTVFKIAIAAVSPKAAMDFVEGNGEIIAIKEVTSDYPISDSKVRKALFDAGFGESEIDWIARTLVQLKITE